MKTKQIIPALLAAMFLTIGVAHAQSVSDDIVNGVKLRGDGSVDDTQPGIVGGATGGTGLKLRGDGSVDDTQPGSPAGSDDVVGGVKRRGDGSIDDNSTPGSETGDDRRSGRAKQVLSSDPRERRSERAKSRVEDNRERHETRVKTREVVDGVRVRTETRERTEIRDRGDRTERSERTERAERGERQERSGRD